MEEGVLEEVKAAICRRVIIAQMLYAIGALRCFMSAKESIGCGYILQWRRSWGGSGSTASVWIWQARGDCGERVSAGEMMATERVGR